MPIEVHCPDCQALLRLADEHAGRQARCPSCSAVFAVPAAGAVGGTSGAGATPDIPEPGPAAPDRGPSPASTSGPSAASGPSGDASAGSASAYTAAASGRASNVDASNPYAPTYSEPDARRPGSLTPQRINLDAVYSNAWRIFKDQWVMACVAIVIIGAINFGMNMAQNLLLQIVGSMANEPAVVFAIQVVIGIMLWVIQLWLQIGQTMVMLDIARGREVNLSKLFGGGPYLINTILAVLMVGLVIGLIAVVMIGIPAGVVGVAMQNGEAAAVTALVAAAIAIVPIIVVSLMFSQIQLLIIDRGATAVDSLRQSYEITNGNKLTLFIIGILLAAIGMGAAIVGLLALCIGIIPAMIGVSAFGSLVLVVAYLFMTGQPVAMPRSFAANQAGFVPPAN